MAAEDLRMVREGEGVWEGGEREREREVYARTET